MPKQKLPLWKKLYNYAKAALFFTLALMYVFWSVDIIPDFAGPIIGFADDAIVLVLVTWLTFGLQALIPGGPFGGKKK